MTPYRFLGVSEVARFDTAVQTHKNDWVRHWFSGGREAVISAIACGPENGVAVLRWCRCGNSDEFLAIGATAEDRVALAAALLAAEPQGVEYNDPGSLSGQLALRLLCGIVADLVSRIVPMSGAPAAPQSAPELGESILKPYSGMVGLRIHLPELRDGLYVFLSAALTQRWLKLSGVQLSSQKAPPLTARMQAVGSATIRLSIALHDDALTVGEVRELKTGDVILLSESIRQPLPVRSEAGLAVGECYLGRAQDQRAIRLVKSSEGKKHV